MKVYELPSNVTEFLGADCWKRPILNTGYSMSTRFSRTRMAWQTLMAFGTDGLGFFAGDQQCAGTSSLGPQRTWC
jgi:hypothetical protein